MRESEKREGERDRQTERERGGGEREITSERKREREITSERKREREREKGREIEREGGREGVLRETERDREFHGEITSTSA